MPHHISALPRTSLLRALALLLVTTTACIPCAAFAVEGYNVGEGEEWSSTAPNGNRARQRFTDLSGAAAPRAASPLYNSAPIVAPLTSSAVGSGTFSSQAPSDVGLPALTPITLVAPGTAASSTYSSSSAGLAETPVAAASRHYIPPVSQIMLPSQPLYPSRNDVTATAASSAMPTYQALTGAPVETTVAAPVMVAVPTATPPASVGVETSVAARSELPPLPPPPAILTEASPDTQKVISSPPEIVGSEMASVAPVSAPPLTQQSKAILGNLRPPVKVTGVEKTTRVDVRRVSPEVADIVKKAEEVYESAGVSIRVSQPRIDSTTELERAYESLMGGDDGVAIRIYQDLLRNNPINEEALFGLAATYHRNGQIDNARPLYGRLLAQNPTHREGLNNFLMLVANESPREALQELAQLENRNPDYSPIPAQMGILYERLGEPEIARSKMLRAIEISPDNWVYKYNLATMLDRRGAFADAAAIYRELINASMQGEPIPVDIKALQARLNYIASRTTGTS